MAMDESGEEKETWIAGSMDARGAPIMNRFCARIQEYQQRNTVQHSTVSQRWRRRRRRRSVCRSTGRSRPFTASAPSDSGLSHSGREKLPAVLTLHTSPMHGRAGTSDGILGSSMVGVWVDVGLCRWCFDSAEMKSEIYRRYSVGCPDVYRTVFRVYGTVLYSISFLCLGRRTIQYCTVGKLLSLVCSQDNLSQTIPSHPIPAHPVPCNATPLTPEERNQPTFRVTDQRRAAARTVTDHHMKLWAGKYSKYSTVCVQYSQVTLESQRTLGSASRRPAPAAEPACRWCHPPRTKTACRPL